MNKFKRFASKISKRVKSKKDKLLLPIVKPLAKIGVSANHVTAVSFITGIIAAMSLFYSRNIFLILIIIYTFFDLLDGALARYKKSNSGKGFFVDYTSDRVVELAVLTAVFLIDKQNKELNLIVILGFLFVQITYILNKRKYQILYFDRIYYLLLYFNFYFASLFALCANIILNLIVVSLAFIIEKIQSKRRGRKRATR